MTTTTMHFGPEWMRTKQAPVRTNPSPPLTASAASAGASSYSALVTPTTPAQPDKRDLAHPFRYSKEDLIRIYKEGGGKGGLGLEVERWEGIVRELGADPVSLKEMGDAEKKLFTGPLNSEMRRRPSTDYLALNSPGLSERPKLNHSTTGPGSPLRERIGGFMGRRRDSTDQPPLTLPRKLSQSSLQAPLLSPREALPSPRARIGGAGGFDGVLSDAWSSRRRAPDGLLKANSRNGEGGETQDGPQPVGIKEEEEEHRQNAEGGRNDNQANQADPPPTNNGTHDSVNGNALANSMSNLSVNTSLNPPNATATPRTPNEAPAAGPPPGLPDVNSVEWIYLDPQGQIQGPFNPTVMQKWYDDGYFTPNLLMKRNQIDTEWISVGELAQRAGNSRVFLTPINPVHAGLPRRDPLLDGPSSAAPDGSFGSPFQPAPSRAFRNGMDPFLHNGVVPDSPSSTFSGGRFSNGSPDPAVFGRIGTHQFNDSPVGPRLANIVGGGINPQRRNTFEDNNDATIMPQQPYATFAASRSGSIDVGFNGLDATSAADAGGYSPFNAPRGAQGFLNNREGPRLLNRDLFDRQDPHLGGQYMNNGFPVNGQPYPSSPYGAQTDARSIHSFATQDRQPVPGPLTPHQRAFTPDQSPWPQDNTVRRDPFGADYPTARNTVPISTIQPSQPLAPVQIPQAAVQPPKDQSSWLAASQGVVPEGWGPVPMTTANLGQHNKQQEDEVLKQEGQAAQTAEAAPPAEAETPVEAVPPPESATESVETPQADGATPQKRRRKAAAQAAQPSAAPTPVQAAATKTAPTPAPKPPSPVSVTPEPKSAWLTEDDKKKTAGTPMGLREIQEMEAKKAEARKAAERERERAARAAVAASPSIAEEVQTMSWGLPTSQAGARAATAVKDSPALTAATPASPAGTPPVWTSAPKAPIVKKTMKEIQEEEEQKRKKLAAKEKESVAAAARRGYADTTTKAATPVQIGGAWTTVGASGKANTAVTTPPVRPAVTTAASAKATPTVATPSAASIVSRAAASPAPARSPAVTTTIKLAPPTLKVEESPTPSHEFLKWMTDSLKGLNNSVQLEEITSMLLTFPLDPDPTTVEIISELIYANSTTLDGRRFAAEFVSKRKADAKGGAANAGGKTLSIADVVKTQPKPAQNEWGGFKVVNKKKKGARA